MTWRRPTRSASADDLLAKLGRLTAQARDRAEMHRARVELAEALQREMLPSALPALPGLRTAAGYQPARDGLDIGGDWYDGFRLPDGTLGFSIGDAQGHDVEAAAFMGQVRIALRALAGAVADPGEVLSRLNDLLFSMDTDLFATCTFLRYDPGTRVLASTRAGHIPTVFATAGGGCLVDDGDCGIPLGILPGQHYPVARQRLSGTGAVVLVTDGVVEGPSFALDDGLREVARVAVSGAADPPERLAARVLGVSTHTGHADDAAVLVLRHGGPADGTRRLRTGG
ncbi:serine/threonine-protein phosphatase [Streptomyces sp. PTM05]|uniref:Serine/threonine-protein phosphatase n=1 Tax=Streptantibioticus parmotrematis TaxID=2873249 RepID=A0ABS7QM73_9ACTN|nr:PP2C family protein-serine/threonine phosphatase [Streptantibioticus parmotrematis]MBY8883485.1 serine/threonine-protein phosphatase [Streptantibioticus parmotrematis]